MIACICVAALMLQIGGVTVQAAGLSNGSGTMQVSAGGGYLYFSYEGPWSNYIGERIQLRTDSGADLGAMSEIVINAGNNDESGSFSVNNAWGSAISGAGGTVTNFDKQQYYGYGSMKWTMQVPVSAYAAYDFSNLTVSWGGQSTTMKVKESTEATTEQATEVTTEETSTEVPTEDTTEATTETTEEATTEVTTEEITEATTEATTGATTETTEDTTEDAGGSAGGIIGNGNIVIDGMYQDWDQLPKTEITYTSNNKQCNHYGQLCTDGKYLYGHFKANELYTSQMQIQLWYLTINGQTFHMQMRPSRYDYTIPSSEGTHTNLKVFLGYGSDNACDSNVIYTIYDASHAQDTLGDEIEFSISLEDIARITGIPQDQMGTITISNPNLGGQGVSIAGSSTGPVAGVAAALCMAVAYFRRKKEII